VTQQKNTQVEQEKSFAKSRERFLESAFNYTY